MALVVCALAGRAHAAQLPQMPANQYVRAVVQREMSARGTHAYRFRLRRETPKGSEIREMVQTREGMVARVVARNDKPLSAEDRRKDDERLRRLLSEPAAQEAKKLIRSLPDAFYYEYDGLEEAKTGTQVRLKFAPNPDFDPPSRETVIFKEMVGTMWVDAATQRIAKLDATLTDDVTIGWGIIGRLHRGGRFAMEQTKLDETWVISRMSLDFTGRALLFRKIVIKQTQNTYDFKRIPAGLSLAQGVELLRKEAEAPKISAAR
jgi:hypothetical protein